MGRTRLLLVVIILIILVAVVVAVLLPQLTQAPPPPPEQEVVQVDDATPVPTPTPIEMVEIVIALQDLPRGFRIPPNAVTLSPYPRDVVPFNAITNLEDVIGRIARTDIFREQPILSNLVVEDLTDIARVGSDAAAILPSNLVAVSVPMDRLTSVAYAVQDGDRVDVIVSMLFVDVDEVYQSLVPNEVTLFNITEEGIQFIPSQPGRPETSALGPVIIGPSEPQRPRLVTQRTVQDAFVVHVGNFPNNGRFIGVPPTPTPVPVVNEDGDTGDPNTPPPPTPTPERPDIITLGVSPQDAVVLVWAIESRLPITFALRSASDTSRVPTTPVTLDYMMNEFNITLPVKRPFALEPAIRSIRQIVAEQEIALEGQ